MRQSTFYGEVDVSSDRYTKVVLTVIAVCLCVLTLGEVSLLDPTARAEASSVDFSPPGTREQQKTSNAVAGPRAPTSTLPLRWRIPTAVERVGSAETYCSTVVSVRNLTTSSVSVEVEWFDWDGTTQKLRPMTLPARNLLQWATNNAIVLLPYYADDDALILGFIGYANVNADDPRILVTATVLCRDGTAGDSKVLSQNELPVFPVGATMEYFQAGMPVGWTPPRAMPE